MNSSPKASMLKRLGNDIRIACRNVASGQPASSAPRASRPIGEWLSSVRQPRGDFLSQVLSRRFAGKNSAERWGDLTRTHVTRIKGNRGQINDAVVRDHGAY